MPDTAAFDRHDLVVADPAADVLPPSRPRRLVCRPCGHTATWSSPGRSSWWGAAVDPFFQQPLWLTTTVRGHRLWAYNRQHLTLLGEYVAADLRERGPYGGCSMSMIEKLPAWIKSAGNRADVLIAVARLRARLDDPGRVATRRRRHPARQTDLHRRGAYELR